MRIPKHIGIIPDGNRRWAVGQGMGKDAGYASGISPGMTLYHICRELGVEELTFYGFTVDNTKRPRNQRLAFTKACVEAVEEIAAEDTQVLVLGNSKSAMFPEELLPYTTRQTNEKGGMKINFLVNYSWEWDLGLREKREGGILATSDLYVIDDYWPDFKPQHVEEAIRWYQKQDVTLGG